MRNSLEQREPRDEVWLPLIEALTWVLFNHSVSLEELSSNTENPRGPKHQELRAMLEGTWQKIADLASVGTLRVRGKRDGEKLEQDLSLDDLRNCRHLAWTRLDDSSRRGWLQTGAASRTWVVRVERHPDTWEGAWERLGDAPGYDYYNVFVLRSELMQLFPASSPAVRKTKSSAAERRRATEWLADWCDTNDPQLKRKADAISELRTRFRLSGRQADNVWSNVTADRPHWRAPGRRRENPAHENIAV